MSSPSLSDAKLDECSQVAEEVARRAGETIRQTWGKCKSVETKQSFADLVTETDKSVEKFVFTELKSKFPDHKFIGEEGVSNEDNNKIELTDEPTWIVDPVDGTMNFVHTFPYVAVAIGLVVNKSPVLGIVYCPPLNQMFRARQGGGAFCNDQPIRVSNRPSLSQSLISTEIGSDRSEEKWRCVFDNMQSISWRCHGIRALGSAAMNMCAVASGSTQAFYEFGLHCWDMCAPAVILLEAGGCVCDTTGPNGRPFNLMARRLIGACNEQVAREISQALVSQLELESD